MSQPKWKLIAQLGDASPVEHGGYWVFEDTTGVYAPEAELFEPNDETGGGDVYRFSLDKCTYIDGVLSDNKFHPDVAVWYADDIPSIEASCDHEHLIADLCSESTVIRAWAYRSLVGYHGPYEFDQYPLTLTKRESKRRYNTKKYGGK